MDRKIYVKPINGLPINSAKDVIDTLYRHPNLTRRSYANPTFSDKDCTVPECTAMRRSFEDLLCLVQTSFPDTTETDLMLILKELEIRFYFCSDIRKIVFHRQGLYRLSGNQFNSLSVRPNSYTRQEPPTYTAERLAEIYEKAVHKYEEAH